MFFSSFSSLKKILQDWHKSNSKQPRIAGSSIKRSTSWSWTVCVCGPTGPALLTGKHRVHWAALTTTTTSSSSFLSTHTGLLFFLLVIPNFLILLVSSHTHKPASSFFTSSVLFFHNLEVSLLLKLFPSLPSSTDFFQRLAILQVCSP